MTLPTWQTIPLFVLILGILVLLHELGHFVTAKFFGMSAPEFAIGFPPRLLTLWKSPGWIELQGRRLVVPTTFKMPPKVGIGTQVVFKTATVKGREVLAGLDVVDAESRGLTLASRVQNLDPGTIYTLNLLPFGGYVRLSGEEDPNAPNAFAAKPAWQRIIVLSAGVTMNFLLALVVMTTLAASLPTPVVANAGTQITGVSPDSPAAAAGLRPGDTIVSLGGVDVKNNYDELRKQVALDGDKSVLLVVERAGRTGPETFTAEITPRAHPPSGQGALGVLLNRQVGVRVTEVAPGSLADQAGLRPGDGLVSVGNDFALISPDPGGIFSTGVRDEKALAAYVASHRGVGYVVPVTYIRGDQVQPPLTLRLPADLPPDRAGLGISFHPNLPQAVGSAFAQMVDAVGSIPRVVEGIFQRGPEGGGFVGPVGIVRLTGEVAARGGFWGIFNLLGVLSLNLAVVNLFPFPGLDGGRLIFIFLEMLRGGRKVDPQKESIVHLVGFLVLISLILFISYYDITGWLAGKPLLGP